MRHLLVVVLTTLGTAAVLAACGSAPASTPANGTKVVDITVAGRHVSPSGAAVAVRRGQAVELDIHADTSGALHIDAVPSSREQTIEYHAGTTQASLGPFHIACRIAVRGARSVAVVMLRVR